jgi:hypothetical protein
MTERMGKGRSRPGQGRGAIASSDGRRALLGALVALLVAVVVPGPPASRAAGPAVIAPAGRLYLPIVSPPSRALPALALSPPHGLYDGPVDVRIEGATRGATVYYTLDGTAPAPSSPNAFAYGGAIRLDRTAVLRAAAFRSGQDPSPIVTASYILPDDVARQGRLPACRRPEGEAACFPYFWGYFSNTLPPNFGPGTMIASDYEVDPRVVRAHRDTWRDDLRSLPTVSLSTAPDDMFDAARGIYANPEATGPEWERPASVELILPDGRPGFQVDAGVRIAGRWSRKPESMAKHSFSLRFSKQYGPGKLRYRLFDDSPVEEFDTLRLRAGQADTFNFAPEHAQFVYDQWGRDSQRDMGWASAHGRFVHLYVDGLYWGLYNLTEEPTADFAASHLGGTAADWDVIKEGHEVEDGTLDAYAAMVAITREGPPTPERYERLHGLLDLVQTADYHLLQIFGGNGDWPVNNWRAARNRGGGAFQFFVWDMEHVVPLDTDAVDGNIADTEGVDGLFGWLRQSPDFRLLFADRVQRHLFDGGALTPAASWRRYDERARQVERAVVGESARWGDVVPGLRTFAENFDQWCGYLSNVCHVECRQAKAAGCPQTLESQWQPRRDWVRDVFFPARTAVVLGQLCAVGLYPPIVAPLFEPSGGTLAHGQRLAIGRATDAPGCPDARADGVIWYTLDGSDPREAWSGRPSRSARLYRGPLALAGYARVMARAAVEADGGLAWSAAAAATYGAPRIDFSELMYHPPEGEDHEWLELANREAFEVDLSGMVTHGVTATLPAGTRLGPGEHLVLAASADAFAEDHPGVPLAAAFSGKLSDKGERLTLSTASGELVAALSYSDEGFWPRSPDGHGWSLVRAEGSHAADDPEGWRASAAPGGSPGLADPPPPYQPVVVNEVLPRAAPPFEPAVELYNPGSAPAPVGGWGLGLDEDDPFAYRLPLDAVIPPGGYRVVYAADLGGSLSLPPGGGTLFLASADSAGRPTGLLLGAELEPLDEGLSVGRLRTSVRLAWDALAHPTFGVEQPGSVEDFRTGSGAPNSPPRIGPVVLNEIMYHPAGSAPEYVELYNPGPSAIRLGNAADPRDRWRLAGAVEYTIAAGTEIPPGGYILLTGGSPSEVRRAYRVSLDVPVFGPWQGKLDNAGEELQLLAPVALGDAIVDGRMERVSYGSAPPWRAAADGGGPSLERIDPAAYGDEPNNWSAFSANGTAGRANTRPHPVWLPLAARTP